MNFFFFHIHSLGWELIKEGDRNNFLRRRKKNINLSHTNHVPSSLNKANIFSRTMVVSVTKLKQLEDFVWDKKILNAMKTKLRNTRI